MVDFILFILGLLFITVCVYFITLILKTFIEFILYSLNISLPIWCYPFYCTKIKRYIRGHIIIEQDKTLLFSNYGVINWGILCKIKHNYKFENQCLNIGCKFKLIEDWDYFFSDKSSETFETPRNTLEFKKLTYQYKIFREELLKQYTKVENNNADKHRK